MYLCLTPELRTSRLLFNNMARRDVRCITLDARRILGSRGLTDDVVISEPTAEPQTVTVNGTIHTSATKAARHICQLLEEHRQAGYMSEWSKREMSSAVLESIADTNLSAQWIIKGGLSALNFRNVLGAQEGLLYTRVHSKPENNLCRHCHQSKETSKHIVADCSHFRATLMVGRHDTALRALYTALCIKFGFPMVHYSQDILPVVENDKAKIYWNLNVVVEKKLKHNKPDLVVFDHTAKRILIVEMGISWFGRLDTQWEIKYGKYAINSMVEDETALPYHPGTNLRGEMENMHTGYSATVIPIIIGCCGELSNKTHDGMSHLELAPGVLKDVVERMQRSAAIGTSRIIRAHLSTD
jgi:hypothetical protein